MEWINFRHLYSFWMVCKHSGFKNAAEAMHVSQSSVSEQVSQLEDYFENKLLERTTRSVNLTNTGRDLLQRADKIFQESRDINHFIRDHKSSNTPISMKIGIVGGISRNFLYSSLSQVMENIETVDISVMNGEFEILNKMLKSFELDIVFALELPQRKDLMSLGYKKVDSSPLCLAGDKEIIRSLKSKRKRPKDFLVYNFQHPQQGHIVTKTIERQFNINVNTRLETDDISLLRFFANSGEGLAVIPEIGVDEDIRSGRLAAVPLRSVPKIDFFAIYMQDGLHEKMLNSFL